MSNQKFLDLFLEKLRSLFSLVQRSSKKKVDEELIDEYTDGMVDEEKDVIKDTCDFVDTYYQKRKEMEESCKDPIDWFNEDIEATAKELIPDATPEEVEEIKKGVAQGIEERCVLHAKALEEEMGDVADHLQQEGGNQ